MNKKALFIGAIFLTVAITIIIPAAATAGPKEEAEPAQVTLIGITTTLGRTQALLRVKWPARVSNREASYMLSEGQSQDGLTLDSLGVTNAIVTLKAKAPPGRSRSRSARKKATTEKPSPNASPS